METTGYSTITSLEIDGNHLIIRSGENIYTWKLTEVSKKIAQASEDERNNFQISPSGYGIHWPLLDEDLSLNGLLRANTSYLP